MTISVRATSHGDNGGTSSFSFTPTLPTWQPGDVVVVSYTSAGFNGTRDTIHAAGWTTWVSSNINSTGPLVVSAYRVMQTGDTNPTFGSTNDASPWIWVAASFMGVNNASVVDGTSSPASGSTAGAVTTSHGSAMLLALFAGSGLSLTGATGYTNQVQDNESGANSASLLLATKTAGTAGSQPAATDTSGNATSAWQLALNAQAPPLAPTLTAPANGSYADLAAGTTFAWTYNPATSGVTQTAYALRRKVGAGAYEWWNAGTVAWQSTEVFNTSSAGSVAFAAGKWSNGSTYSWSVATQDSNGTGAYSADITVTGSVAPTATVTAPTGTVAGATPSVTWTETLQSGALQTAYRVVVESGGYGATPGSGTTVWDSSVVSSAALTVTVGALLANGSSYRAFVQVTETGGQTSPWAFNTFTVTYNTPATPTIIAVWDSTLARCALAVQGRDNMLSANASSIETDATAWVAAGNCTVARSTAQAIDGTASLSMTSTAAGDMSARTVLNAVPIVAGKVYTFVASFRAATVARAVHVEAYWMQSDGTTIISVPVGASTADNTAGWQQATLTAQAPSNAAFAVVQPVVSATGAASEVHYVDRMGIFPNPTGNLVTNPDFENGTAGWSADVGSPTLSEDTTQAWTGRASLKATNSASTTDCAVAALSVTSVVSGVACTVSAWVRTSYAASCRWDTAGALVSAGTPVAVAANTWTRVTQTFTPISSGALSIFLHSLGTVSSASTVNIDAVQLVVGSTATTYIPPSVSNLITNPSFDADLSGWAAIGSAPPLATRNTTRVYPGSLASVQLAWVAGSNNGTAGYINQSMTVLLGQTYTLSAWVYVPSGSTPVEIVAYGAPITGTARSAASSVNDTWQRLTITFAATATGIPTLQLNIANGQSAAVGSVVYVDATQLELGAVANAYVGGALGPGYSWDSSQNLLAAAAASFEDGTVGGWAAVGTGTTVANSATRAQDGTKSLLVTLGAGAAGGFGASVNLTLAPNTTYTYSVYVYLPSAGVASTELQVSGTGVTTVTETPVTTTNSFVRHALTFTTNATGGTVTIKVLNGATSTAGQTFFIDAAQVEQRSYATPYNQAGTANAATSTSQQPWTIGGFAGTGSYTIEASEDGGTTWTAVRGSGSFTVDSAANQVVTAYDYERTPLVTATYRARVSDGNGASRVTSLNSPTAQATSIYTSWWIKDPVDSTLNAPVNVTTWAPKVSERAGTFIALGRSKPIVVSDSIGGMDGTVTISTFTQADVAAVKTIMTRQRVLLLQSPMGEQFYIRINADRTVTLPGAWAWQRDVQLPYVESDAP